MRICGPMPRAGRLAERLPLSETITPALRGHLAMLAFALLVAGSFSLGAKAANDIAPTALNAARFGIATLLMLAIALALGSPPRRAHLTAPWRYAVLGGLYAFYFVMMFEGLKTAPPVSTAAVFTLTPLMTAGFGWILLSQRMTPRMSLALSIGGLGAIWVVFRADLAALIAFAPGRGEAIFFIGCIGHAILTPMVRRLDRGEPAAVSSGFVMLGGCLVLVAFAPGDLVATDWTTLPAPVWIALAYLGIVTTAGTFLLLQYASHRIPAAKVMAYTYLVPSFVILWELSLGNPPPPALILPGIGLTILALFLLLKDEDRPGRTG